MYHIKFFKVPSITKGKGYEIKTVLTLTNDLGDFFFFGEADIVVTIVGTKLKQVLHWSPGMQSVNVKFEGNKLPNEVQLKAEVDHDSVVDCLNDEEDKRAEYFFPLTSIKIKTPVSNTTIQSDRYALRTIDNIEMIEETGHAIAKKVWDGGIITAKYLKQNPGFISPKNPQRIIELGAGCGLLSLALARLYHCKVVTTDLDDAKEICELNIKKANETRVKFETLDWEDCSGREESYDLVIATDCTYNESYFDPLLTALHSLSSKNSTIIIGHKYRNAAEEGFFEKFGQQFQVLFDERIDMLGESVRLVKACIKC